jgi:hypothetical protein
MLLVLFWLHNTAAAAFNICLKLPYANRCLSVPATAVKVTTSRRPATRAGGSAAQTPTAASRPHLQL